MTDLTLMTAAEDPATVLPSLALLPHRVRVLPLDLASIVRLPEDTILFVDARDDLATAKTVCLMMHASGLTIPIILILTDGGFPVVTAEWGTTDMVLASASPAEVEGRLRLAGERQPVRADTVQKLDAPALSDEQDGLLRCGDLVMDVNGYTASLHGHPLDLWGYDYYGGTRTVDVHIRRLRAKLGGEYEHMIGTVRNVGYRFDPPEDALGDE